MVVVVVHLFVVRFGLVCYCGIPYAGHQRIGDLRVSMAAKLKIAPQNIELRFSSTNRIFWFQLPRLVYASFNIVLVLFVGFGPKFCQFGG